MSHQPSHSTEHMPPPAEQAGEGIRFGMVTTVGVATLLIFFLLGLYTHRMMRGTEKMLQPQGPDPIPQAIGQPEIGIVDQVPFDVSRGLENYRRDRYGLLESWGWVDRKRGVIHIPIDQAMDDIVEKERRK